MSGRRTLQERLSTQRALIGFMQTHPNAALTELTGMCGYDFLFIDDEHGVFSQSDHVQALQALAGTEALAMVRLAGHDLQAVGRYLDMGADAIIVPNVSTVEQAQALARAMHYPPAGTRGFGAALHRSTRYGLDLAVHLEAPRGGASLLVVIESALGASNAQDILTVDGVDGVIVGPYDLSADLGAAGDFSRPAYAEALARIEHAASANGKWLGTVPHPGYPLETLLVRGHRLLIVGVDISLIRAAMSAQVAEAQSRL